MSRAWTRDELATLRADLSEIAAAVAVDSAFWRPSRAARQASRAGRPRLDVLAHLVAAARAMAHDWRRLGICIVLPALIFGGLAADRPFGAPSFGGMQALLGVAVLAAAIGFGWEDVIRTRLGVGGGAINAVRLLRIFKVGGFAMTVLLSLGFTMFFATALLPSLGVPHTGVLDLILTGSVLCLAGPLLFHVISLATDDQRTPAETVQLLAGNMLRFSAGSIVTFLPFLIGLGLVPATSGSPFYAPVAAGASALMLAGGVLHAFYLAEVYREVA